MNCFKGGDFIFYCQCFFCAIYQNTVYIYLLRNCFHTINEIKHNKHKQLIYFINLRVYLIIYRWITLKKEMHFTCTTLNSDDWLSACVSINLIARKFLQQCYHNSDTSTIFYNSWNTHHCGKCRSLPQAEEIVRGQLIFHFVN